MSAEPTDEKEESAESVGSPSDSVDGESVEKSDVDESVGEHEDSETAEAAVESPSTETRQKGPNEMFCSFCGAVIKKRAEICPDCGVATDGGAGGVSTTGTSSARGTTGGSSSGKTKYTVGGIVSGLVGFVLLPIVFGPIAVYCGYQVYQNHDETHGIALIAWGGLSLVVGMAFGALMFA
ncbi:eL43 family ribosomal protein [Halobaculum gomorrense]|uniref:Zinc-ribbon domain-containing protein n=1 Tax=Halobaculum gomorrense TaxID=43928 RepID=A0A1M5S021_9EURY|nr:hypothetical protein [Halobaculum gomorrense]SHH31774.1 hypothetical protein SAMN05443636_2290 [Halobaculum gomorrense]